MSKPNTGNEPLTLEQLQSQFISLQEQFTASQNKNKEQETTITNLQKTNDDLMKSNHKLFLSVTGSITNEDENNDTEQEYKEYVGEKFWDSLSKKEQEKLKVILVGDDE